DVANEAYPGRRAGDRHAALPTRIQQVVEGFGRVFGLDQRGVVAKSNIRLADRGEHAVRVDGVLGVVGQLGRAERLQGAGVLQDAGRVGRGLQDVEVVAVGAVLLEDARDQLLVRGAEAVDL